MKKMRISELAKELSIETKDLLRIAKDLAIPVENIMSIVDVHDIERIQKRLEKDIQKKEDDVPQEEYVEKRVSANIIRRRARVAPTQEKEPVAAGSQPEEPEQKLDQPAEGEKKPTKEQKKPTRKKKEETIEPAAPEEIPAGESQEAVEIPLEAQSESLVQRELASEDTRAPEVSAPESGDVPTQAEAFPEIPLKEPEGEEGKPAEKKEEEDKEKKKEKKKGKKPRVLEEVEKEGEKEKESAARPGVKKPKKVREKEVYTQSDLYGAVRTGPGKKQKKRKDKRGLAAVAPAKRKPIKIGKAIVVSALAKEMGVKVSEVIKILMDLGVLVTANQYISSEDAILVSEELGYEVEEIRDEIKEDFYTEPTYSPEDLSPRPPVVTVMGHVDHGKTSLLDAIRSENVMETEFGGITQHIGAYQAHCKGKLITFIDTPGHEAFTSMRSRGAKATDFVVLVVAADDGVMDQTREAINHAKAADIPILIAVNKIDKPNANPLRVREQLSEFGLVPEDWGGETIYVDVSAKNRVGIEDLLEMILLQAEIMDIKACSKGNARGVVLEAKLDKSRGPMCSVLIQHGEMKRGDVFIVGTTWGKARAMFDFRGKPLNQAFPATPVEILGFSEIPSAGDSFFVVPGEKKAKEIVAYLQNNREIARQQIQEQKPQVTLEDLYNQVQAGKIKELNIILKGDVHGSVEAIENAIQGIDTGESMRITILHAGVGGITENDVLLASTSLSIILGFNVRPEPKVRELAKKHQVEIKLYSIIYDLIEDIKKALHGMLEPVFKEVVNGRAEVRDLFRVPKIGVIAGCMVTDGTISRGSHVRILRDNVVVHQGKVESLKRFKDDARDVASGFECGIGIGNFNDLKIGDVIESFSQERVETDSPW
ncbi:MAG TPA: translation initiation factor IF-2 [Deltaproteobacteria bacterium]|nr:translation initiation factor IF-2 [Deltaproteobacteria bacterium]